jgi:hypothetical protein
MDFFLLGHQGRGTWDEAAPRYLTAQVISRAGLSLKGHSKKGVAADIRDRGVSVGLIARAARRIEGRGDVGKM